MAERLETITRDLDPMENPFLNSARVQILHTQLQPLVKAPPTERTATARFNAHLKYATELLNAGKSEEALRNFQGIEAFLTQMNTYDVRQFGSGGHPACRAGASGPAEKSAAPRNPTNMMRVCSGLALTVRQDV
jgi:hypothetical protein